MSDERIRRAVKGLPVWLLVGLLLVGAASAAWVAVQRFKVEEGNRTVELILDYPDAARLAGQIGQTDRQVVGAFKEAGVTSLAVGEYSVADYLRGGSVVAVPGREILSREALGEPLPPLLRELRRRGAFQARAVYLFATNARARKDFGAALARRLPKEDFTRRQVGGQLVWEVRRDYNWLLGLDLGLAPDQLRLAARFGLRVAPRWSNAASLTSSQVAEVVAEVPAGQGSTAVFTGKEVLGYPSLLEEVAAQLGRAGLRFGLVEFADQEGEEELARLLGYHVVRVHSITSREMAKIRPEVAVARDLRAIRERSIRALYLRPFLEGTQVEGGDALAFNLEYVRTLRQGMAKLGLTAGPGEMVPALPAPRPILGLLTLGALAGGLLLLRRYVTAGAAFETAILLLGTLGAVAGATAGRGQLIRQLFALGAGVVFSTMGVLAGRDVLRREGRGKALAAFAAASAHALTGALFVVGFLGETRFMAAVATFSGVKLLHAAPLLLVWFVLAREALRLRELERAQAVEPGAPGQAEHWGWRRLWQDLRRLLANPVTWEQACLVVVAAGVLVFYLLRTGTYTNVPTPAWERAAREALERWLEIRPRTKEFLVGHPALLLAFLFEAKGLRGPLLWLLYLAGTIGQLSMVDTFSHIHTPLWISAVRTGLGLALGLAIGWVAYVAYGCVVRLWRSQRANAPATGGGEA